MAKKPNSITGRYGNEVDASSSKLVLQDEGELVALYSFIAKQEEGLQELKKKLDIKRAEEARKIAQEQAKNLANFELDLEKNGISITAELRKMFLERDIKERAEKEQQNIINQFKLKSSLELAQERMKDANREKDLKLVEINKQILLAQKDIEKAKRSADKDAIKAAELKKKNLEEERKQKEKELKKEAEYINARKELSKEETNEKIKESLKSQFQELYKQLYDENGNKRMAGDVAKQTAIDSMIKTLQGVGKAIDEGLNRINSAISTYAGYQTEINARLQGVGSFNKSIDTLSDVAYSPLVKTEELYANLSNLVGEGISSNVEQKAFLQTIKKGIATTFDVNTQALKEIIRIQQFDSTASRLGMEAYLTRFLNEFAQNTEYLSTTFDSVTESLLQASSLMTGQEATEFEYIVQKWLGALTGVGLSEATARSIADAIGKVGSGQLSDSAVQNLVIMAASRSGGTSFADMLTGGVTNYSTNTLMSSIVTYLQELGSYDNNVVKQQLAQTFGVSMSDLQAIKNLSDSDIRRLQENMMSYSGMYNELGYQMGELRERLGISNILENLFSNLTFQTGMNIASNPAAFATWKITDLIQGVTGGINIPFISALGTGVDLNTTVENLMKLGIVGATTLGSIGDIISGISSVQNGASLLNSLGIGASSSTNIVRRGSGLQARASEMSTSLTTMIGNTDSGAYYESTLNAASDETTQKLAEAKGETTEYNQEIYNMLEDIDFGDKMASIDKNLGDIYDFLSNESIFFGMGPIEGWSQNPYE